MTDIKKQNLDNLIKKKEEIKNKHGLLYWKGNDVNIKNRIFSFMSSKDKKMNFNADYVELYKNGVITYEKADKLLSQKAIVDDSSVNIISSIVTGAAATSLGLFLKGKYNLSIKSITAISALVGGTINAGIKFIDKAGNNIDKDALDFKTISKDFGCGMINGAFSGINAGYGKEFSEKSFLKKIGIEILKQVGLFTANKVISNKKTKTNKFD